MSHELRTPLNAIIGFSEVLSERMFGDVNDKQAEYLGDIQESGRHLLSLINDILDLSKIEAGRMELERSEFDLARAIGQTLLLVRERAERRGIALRVTVDDTLGTIVADERKVKQVLLNLLSNALKFTPEGGTIDVRGSVRDGDAESRSPTPASASRRRIRTRYSRSSARSARPRDLEAHRRTARGLHFRRQHTRRGVDLHVPLAAAARLREARTRDLTRSGLPPSETPRSPRPAPRCRARDRHRRAH